MEPTDSATVPAPSPSATHAPISAARDPQSLERALAAKQSWRLVVAWVPAKHAPAAENAEAWGVIDAFPHRLHPEPGIPRRDMILAFLARAVTIDHPAKFFRPHVTLASLVSGGKVHSGRIGMGAFAAAPEAAPGSGDELALVHAGAVHLACGTRVPLAAMHLRGQEFRRDMRHGRTPQRCILDSPTVEYLAGAVDRALPVQTDGNLLQTGLELIAARLARLTTATRAAGVAASRAAQRDAGTFLEALFAHHAITGDRPWAPPRLVATDQMKPALRGADPQSLHLGACAWDALPHRLDHAFLEFAVAGCTDRLSAHATLDFRRRLKAFDRALEAAAPLMHLTPGPRKRQAQLRNG